MKLIIYTIVSLISTFGITYLYYKLAKCDKIKPKTIITFLVGVIIITTIKYFDIKIISFCIFFIYYPILFWIMKKQPIKKLIYYVLTIWFIGIFMDLLSMSLMSLLHMILAFDLLENWIFASITMSLTSFLCFILIARTNKIIILVEKIYNKITNIKYADLLILLLAIYVFISCYVILSSLPNLTIDILLNLLIILFAIVFIFLIKYKINETEISKYLKNLKDNNDFYVSINDENRIFKHNLIAKLLSVKSVSNKKGMLLIDELIKEFNRNIDFSKNIKIIPYGLNGIVYQKLYVVKDKINFYVNNNIQYDIFDVLKPLRYNVLIEKLSLVLDNAIEASSNSKDKIIYIDICEENDKIIIEIKNTFSSTIDLDIIGNKNYSTKGSKRGLGLFSALRNNEVTLKVNIINNLFICKLSVQKNKN